MGHTEFLEWMAFYDTEPFGETRAELHMAVLAATIANANRGKKKPVKVSRFVTDWWKDKSKPQALMAKMRAVTARWTHGRNRDPGSSTRNR